MKKSLLFALSAVTAMSAFGQAKVQEQSFSYSRSSLSVIALDGLTSYDKLNDEISAAQDFDGKFDMNTIKLKTLKVANNAAAIQEALNKEGVAKQALNFIVSYDGKSMNNNLITERAYYNASDADILKEQASKASGMAKEGQGLLKNIYFMVAGPTSVVPVKDKKTGKITGYSASVDAYVYKAVIDDATMDAVRENWVYADYKGAELQKAKTGYEAINIPVELVASKADITGSGKTEQASIAAAYNGILEPMEKQIDAWNVVTSIFQKHPLGAKIGTKEGLKNSDRYRAYAVTEDAAGNIVYKDKGYVRATKVINNSHVATGKSDCSHFYQISGGILQKGMFLKQKKDTRIGVSAYYNIGEDALSTYGLDIDYLAYTQQFGGMGIMHYGIIGIGFDNEDIGDGDDLQFLPATLGYGIGIRPIRPLEIMPYIHGGIDYFFGFNGDTGDDDDEDSFSKRCGYAVGAGVKASWQVWYPVQVFVKADYTTSVGGGEIYELAKECCENERKGGFALGIGAKITF